jgi:hypothetical protein
MPTVKLDVNGTNVQVEYEGPSGQVKAGAMEDLEARFDDALAIIKEMASSCNQAFMDLSESLRPSETTITFGLKVNGEASWVVGKLGGEANFQVDLKWKYSKEKMV